MKLLVRASLQYCVMNNIYQKNFFIGALKNLSKFSKHFQKKIHAEAFVLRCSTRQVPEKICKLHKKTPVLESLFNKVSRNKETSAQVFSCEFCEALKNTFFTEHLRWNWNLSLKQFYIVGVHKKVFEWLPANEFLSNSKNYLRFFCISISCFSIFSKTCYFY